jgi:hypothetical protein
VTVIWHNTLNKTRESLFFLRAVWFYEGRLQSSWTCLITPSWNFVEVWWRSLFRSTSLGKRCTSYNVPPTSRKRAADRWSLRNFSPQSSLFMVGKPQKSLGARSGLFGGFYNGIPPIHFFQYEHKIRFRSRPMRFLGFSNHEKGAPKQEISKWSTVCRTFSRSGWSVVRSASLAKGGTSKKRPSPHLHKVRTPSNNVIPRNFQTDIVLSLKWILPEVLKIRSSDFYKQADFLKCTYIFICLVPQNFNKYFRTWNF